MTFIVPELSFVVLIGVSGSGKSTFARKHFKPTDMLPSDLGAEFRPPLLHSIERKPVSIGDLEIRGRTSRMSLSCQESWWTHGSTALSHERWRTNAT